MQKLIYSILLALVSINLQAMSLFTEERFSTFDEETSFVVFQKYDNGADDDSIRARYSFEYLFAKSEPENNKNIDIGFSYTGEFDFYIFTRNSGPVINRTNNPALNFRYNLDNSDFSTNFLNISTVGFSLEHRSNGQVTSVYAKERRSGQYNTQVALTNGDHEYFDGLSREADYITLKTNLQVGYNHKDEYKCDATLLCADVWLSYKIYIQDGSSITWGKDALSNTSIKDYDIFRVRAINTFEIFTQSVTVETDYRLGNEYFKTDSIDLGISVPYEIDTTYKVPFYLRFHSGPMDRLSNYTKNYNSIAFGLVFTYDE